MTRDWKRLGRAIEEARRARGWSQQDLADACSVGRSTIQAAERGRGYTRLPASFFVIERTLGWPEGTVENVLAGGDPPTPAPTSEEPARPSRPQFAHGMPMRIAEELSSGDVVDTAVLNLSDSDDGPRLVAVFKADDAAAVDPEEMRVALNRWVQAQRKLHGLPTSDEAP